MHADVYSSHRLLLRDLDVIFLERGIAHTGRAASEQFVALRRLGEGHDVAQGGGVAQERNQSEHDV